MGKGKHWLLTEDTALAEAWVQVAEEAQTGGPDDTFWGAVHENWVARLGGSQRSQQALKNHWAFVQRAVRTFSQYVHAATTTNDTARDNDDESTESDSESTQPVSDEAIDRALNQYLESEGESFALLPVWAVLHKSPKWHTSKTPGSSLKRSRTNASVVGAAKTNKRMSLPAGVGNGLPLPTTSTPAPVVTHPPMALPPQPTVSAVMRPVPAASRFSSNANARALLTGTHSDATTAATVARMLPVANSSSSSSSSGDRDSSSYAAAVAALAAAQRARNDVAADELLLTMLLTDPVDATNRQLLAQLKRKYVARAFPAGSA